MFLISLKQAHCTHNVAMNFLIEVCIQYGRGKLANVNDQRGAFTFLSFLRLWAKHSSTRREGTFANCSRFTKLHVGRPISTLCIRDIPFPVAAHTVREPISRRNSFSPCARPIFNLKRRNELFSAPFQRIYPPPGRVSRCWLPGLRSPSPPP